MTEELGWNEPNVPLDVMRDWWERADTASVGYRGDQIIELTNRGFKVFSIQKDAHALTDRQRLLLRSMEPDEAVDVLALTKLIRSLPNVWGTPEDLALLLYREGIRPPVTDTNPEEPVEETNG